MAASSDAAQLVDESDDFAERNRPLADGDFVTRTEFDLAVKQIMVKLISVQIRSLRTNIGVLEALLNNISKH